MHIYLSALQGLDEDEDSLIDFMVNEISSSFKTMEESFDVSCPGVYLFLGDEYSTLGETPSQVQLMVTYRTGGGIKYSSTVCCKFSSDS